jgi:hypothetical protein
MIFSKRGAPRPAHPDIGKFHKSNYWAHGGVARCSESSCTQVHSGVLRSGRLALHPNHRISETYRKKAAQKNAAGFSLSA